MTVTANGFFDMASLSEASYVLFDQIRDADFSDRNVEAALQDPSKEGEFSAAQAAEFVKHWQVVDHLPDTDFSGFSATLFRNKDTGRTVLAIRGTQGLADVVETDVHEIVGNGLAFRQIIDLYNYWMRLGADFGATIRQARLVPADDSTLSDAIIHEGFANPINSPLDRSWTIQFEDVAGAGLGKSEYANALEAVTGHSLGGHLAAAFTRLFSLPNVDAYTINGAGYATGLLPGLGFTAETNISNLFSMLEGATVFNPSRIFNVYGDKLLELITMDGIAGLQQPGTGHEPIHIEKAGPGDTFGHGSGQMTDTLAVYDLLFRLDGALTGATAEAALQKYMPLMQASASRRELTLETVVNQLSILFETGKTITTEGDRQQLHDAILAIQATTLYTQSEGVATIEVLAALPVSSLISLTTTDIAYRYALVHLNPFAVTGAPSLYEPHNAQGDLDLYDPVTGTGTLTAEWIEARAEFLHYRMQAAIADSNVVVTIGDGDTVIYSDLSLDDGHGGLKVEAIQSSVSQVVFGQPDRNSQRIIGGSRDDRLFGGARVDWLYGLAGSDYLEGGKGNDLLDGGAGNDRLRGMGGADTFEFQESFGQDQVLDSDPDDKLIVNGRSVDRLYAVSDTTWQSADKTITATRSGTTLTLSTVSGSITIASFTDGDFSIEFLPAIPDPVYLEVVMGDDTSETLSGGTGNDRINAAGGDDYVDGSAGDDRIEASFGRDGNEGGAGNDVVEGGSGADVLTGDDGADRIYGDKEVDIPEAIAAGEIAMASGLAGEFMHGNHGDDQLVAGADNDFLAGGDGSDLLVGGAGDDHIEGDKNYGFFYSFDPQHPNYIDWKVTETVETPSPNRTIYRYSLSGVAVGYAEDGSGADVIHAGSGNDVVLAGGDDDYIDAGSGNDKAFGHAGADAIHGGDGNDVLGGDGSLEYVPAALHGSDYIDGGAGDDRIFGHGGADTLLGGDGSDEITGDAEDEASGDDYLDGGAGADTLIGSAGNDAIYGGDDNDQLYGDAADNAPERHGSDLLDGGDGDDVLTGAGGNDVLKGGIGNDTLDGDGANVPEAIHGDDYLEGGDGDDVLIGGGGDDTLYGGAGIDNLSGDGIGTPTSAHGDDHLDGGAGNDTLGGFGGNDALMGGEGDDVLDGHAGNDTLDGQIGDDELHGNEGDDRLYGGEGSDLLAGQEGNDVLHGNAGADELQGGDGNDTLSGGDDADVLYGQLGSDTLKGDAGNDSLAGGDGADALLGDAGDDQLFGELGDDALSGGDGADYLSGHLGNDTLTGAAGIDQLYGDAGVDVLDGGADNDTLQGGVDNDAYRFGRGYGQDVITDYDTAAGNVDRILFNADVQPADISLSQPAGTNDLIVKINGTMDQIRIARAFEYDTALKREHYLVENFHFSDGTVWDAATVKAKVLEAATTEGADTIYGFRTDDTIASLGGNDIVQARDGSDIIDGGAGDDTLYGEFGNDTLSGGEGDDRLYGGAGLDELMGGAGNDLLIGESGDDTYHYGRGQGLDQISDYDGNAGNLDQIIFSADIAPTDVVLARPMTSPSALEVRFSGIDDKLSISSYFTGAAYEIERFVFADGTVWDVPAVKAMMLQGTPANDFIIGYGSDDVINGYEGNDDLDGAAGNDVVDGGSGDDYLKGAAGNDDLRGGDGKDRVYGGDGADVLSGGADYDELYGEEGNDSLQGGDGNDYLSGGGGDDTLAGGAGNDLLKGGNSNYGHGNDTYLFGRGYGQDTVEDYNSTAGYSDRVVFAPDVLPADIVTWRFSNDLKMSIAGTPDVLTVDEYFRDDGASPYLIERIEFADGTLWNLTLLTSMVNKPTAGDDTFWGFNTNEAYDLLGGNDYLTAAGGDDTVYGGPGDDSIWGDGGNDTLHGDDGNDSLNGGIGDDTIEGGAGNDLMAGGSGSNHLRGGTGNDTFWAESNDGVDVIAGEDGDDHYHLYNNRHTIIESPGGGVDTITLRTPISFTLGAEFENLNLMAAVVHVNGTGNDLDNVIVGTDGNNVLTGAAGNDRLEGKLGTDSLIGGTGNDTYVIDSRNDAVTENVNEGVDTVITTDSLYWLPANVENLTLIGTATDTSSYGNTLDNVITGNSFANYLTGDLGADTLIGGAGDDNYWVQDAADSVIENLDEGIDGEVLRLLEI